jgi:N12 class adenine-specific DNA methylase
MFGVTCTNGTTSIIVDIDPYEGNLMVKIARPGHPTVDLVDLLDDRTARSLHLQHLPRAASRGVVTSRLTKAARAIEEHLPQILTQD